MPQQYRPHEVKQRGALPELIADALRTAIVNGDLADGTLLPNQDDLSEQFGVSKPTLREAVSMLQAERLVYTRRGKLGGAIVQRPTVAGAAYTLGLLLQGQGTRKSDLASALYLIEPLCAALCAQRKDRARNVVPVLRRAVDDLAAHESGAAETFLAAERMFHDEVVSRCGSPTMAAVVGVLEELWAGQQWAEVEEAQKGGTRRNMVLRRHALESHESILAAIVDGDPDAAAREAAQHLKKMPTLKTKVDPDQRVDVTSMTQRPRPQAG
jgi:GntR family transcriptional repressor for pyruvate dehydrogenase complex